MPRGRIARLNPDGTLDRTFGENLLGVEGDAWIRLHAIVVQTDGKILIGGNFLSVNGEDKSHLVRLQDDGTLDPSFGAGLSGPNNTVHAIALSGETGILIGGRFSEVNGQSRSGLVRLQENGTVDPAFGSHPGVVEAMAQQPDGTILAGYSKLRQIFSNGTVDPRFGTLPGPDFWITAIAIQPDGKILVGGNFSMFNEMPRGRIVRLLGSPQPEPPFGIRLSQTTIIESQSVGARVGFLTALDSDPGDSHTFDLVGGAGDDDNGAFAIDGDVLRLAARLDVELQDTYNIRVRATDRHGLSVETSLQLVIEADAYLVWARGLPENERTPTADPGGFGISNLLRYAFGMNPSNPEREKLPQPGCDRLDPVDDEMYLSLIYSRRTDDASLTYIVEGSFDFAEWLPVNGHEEISGDVKSETEIVTVIDTEPMAANTKRVLRVRVER